MRDMSGSLGEAVEPQSGTAVPYRSRGKSPVGGPQRTILQESENADRAPGQAPDPMRFVFTLVRR